MTDKEFRDQKKRVEKYIDKWYKTLGLGWHQIDFVWERSRWNENPAACARTECMWQYRNGYITFYLEAVLDMSDEQIENTVVHEFVHVISWPMWENAEAGERKENEYATEEITRAILWSREAGKKDA